MNRRDWRTVSSDDVAFDVREIENQLVPVVRKDFLRKADKPKAWAAQLQEECRWKLGAVLPLSDQEKEFLDCLLDEGEIKASLLTTDREIVERIQFHPLIQWKALNVQQYKQQGKKRRHIDE